jgi:hypothetical protein
MMVDNGLHGITKGNETMISIGVYKQGDDLLIGACDDHLLGKKYKEGKLHLHVDKQFYGAKKISKESLRLYLKNATIANLVGETCVSIAIEMGLVDPSCVLYIDGVAHAQMVRML